MRWCIIANLACNESSTWTCIVQKLRYSFVGADVQYIRLHQIKFKHIAVLWLQAILILFIYGDEWKAAVWNSSSILAVFLCNKNTPVVGVSTILMLLLFSSFKFKSCVSIIALSHSIFVGLKQREKFMPVIIKSLFLWNIENVICMWIFSDFVSSFVWTLDIGGNKWSDLQRMDAFHYFLSMQDILSLLVFMNFLSLIESWGENSLLNCDLFKRFNNRLVNSHVYVVWIFL